MSALLIEDIAFQGHHWPHPHVETPHRLACLAPVLGAWPLPRVAPRPARDDEILRVHEPGYLERLLRLEAAGEGCLDPDTYFVRDSLATARLAVGTCLDAADRLLAGEAEAALALVRPPGHHARPSGGMGFCLLNNIALVAAAAAAAGRRVAVLDWDVHHGNGTQDAFWNDGRVLTLSLHQSPLYPYSGEADELGGDAARGLARNIPLRAGCEDADYGYAFDLLVLPLLRAFAPDLLLVAAGFDGHHADPLGAMRLTGPMYHWMVVEAWNAVQQAPLLITLEGGYSLQGLTEGVEQCLRAVTGSRRSAWAPGEPSRAAADRVEEIARAWGDVG